jgi:hypothetical protein
MNRPLKNKKKIVNKDNISEKIKKEIKIICKKYPKIKQKIKNLKDLDKKLYYAMVWEVTESQPLYILENSDKRGWKSYHLDHIYPISMGFKENISPEKIGNIKNLRFIPFEENIKKGSTITSDSLKSLRKIKRLVK